MPRSSYAGTDDTNDEDLMPKYLLHLSDGKETDLEIEAKDNDEAFSFALTALSKFSSSRFPPPEHLEITVRDTKRTRLATFSFTYEFDIVDEEADAAPIPLTSRN